MYMLVCFGAVEKKLIAGGQDPVLVWQEEDPWGPFIINAIKVNTMYIINLDYIKTAANEIKIINRSTGRIAARTRWQDNIHQVSSFRVHTC